MQGRKIQNYIVDDKIGEGGMGAVFKAHHSLMQERKAAIKVLNAQYAGNPHLKERFKNEAAALARLNHSGIVALYDYIEEGQEAFLVMEFAEGTPLDRMIEKNGKLNEKFALELLRQIAEALAYAHSQGIVHRDIKPSNFIVSAEGKVKILDFGIAKMVAEESRHLTKTGMRMGSVYFMSPEQVRGDKDINHRTDLYSLGLMYYVMLTGVYPLESLTSEYAIYDAIVNKDFVNLQELKGKISPVSLFILEKCLQRNPKDRFATALDIVKVIDNPQEISKETPKPVVAEITKKETPIPEKVQPQPTATQKIEKPFTHPSVVPAPKKKNNRFRNFLIIGGLLFALVYFYWNEIYYWIAYDLFSSRQNQEVSSDYADSTRGEKMYVTATNLNLRDAPQTGSVIKVIPYGEPVYVLEQSSHPDWVKVRSGSYEGYVFRYYIADHVKPVYKVISPQAYFYRKSNYDYPTNAYLVAGQFVLAEEESNGFIYTNFKYGGNTTSGWINLQDLERVK
jgi:serine/threonine protein kinase